MIQSILISIVALYMFRWFLEKQRALIAAASQSSAVTTTTATTERKSKTSGSLTRRDIYEAAFILQQRLPPELVPQILDHAGYWLKTSIQSDDGEIVVEDTRYSTTSRCPGSSWVCSLPIGSAETDPEDNVDGARLVGLHPVRKVVFTLESRDQGWSSYPEHHGTENGSWTWFEAFVRDTNQPSYSEQLLAMQGRFNEESDEEGDGSGEESPRPELPLGGRRIMTNVHAGRGWRREVITWGADDEDNEIHEWVTGLKRGQVVDVTVWARYPGWRNRVNFIGIDVYVAVVR